jgi:hypothetical protein
LPLEGGAGTFISETEFVALAGGEYGVGGDDVV